MKIYTNTDHLIEKAAERVRCTDGLPLKLTPEDIERWKQGLEENCPEDWRFTQRSPEFLLTVVTDRAQVKILGTSFRRTAKSFDIRKQIEELIESGVTGDTFSTQIQRIATSNLNSECQPDAEICHKLRTVLSPWMLPTSDLERTNAAESDDLGSALLSHSKLESNLAQRPNALLIDRPGQPIEVWVRQGNPFIRAFSGADRSISFCVFAKLTPAGIDNSVPGQVWKTSGSGWISQTGSAECHRTPKPNTHSIPRGFRSDNYWRVPTHLAHWQAELEFMPSTPEVRRILETINIIRKASEVLNLQRIFNASTE